MFGWKRREPPPIDEGIMGATVRMTAEGRRWYSSDLVVREPAQEDALLKVSGTRMRAELQLDDETWLMRREGVIRGRYLLENGHGRTVARAEPESAWKQTLTVVCQGRKLTLRSVSTWDRVVGLWHGPIRSGTVRPVGWSTSAAEAAMPVYLTRVERVFLLWLVISGWRQQAAAAGG